MSTPWASKPTFDPKIHRKINRYPLVNQHLPDLDLNVLLTVTPCYQYMPVDSCYYKLLRILFVGSILNSVPGFLNTMVVS